SYKFLFIGNSATYVNDIPATLASLCAKKGITITQKQIVPGGRTLEDHAADPAVLAEIAKGYDAVFIQENGNSMTTASAAEKSLAAIKKLGDAVHDSGAVFCFYVRPPYGKDLAGYKNFDQCKLFDDHFTPAAEAQDAHCVYVNRAFAYAIKHLDYNLWGDDNAHTNTHGAYLAVCTFYATLFGKTATELDIAYGLPAADAKALQEAADQIALQGVIPLGRRRKRCCGFRCPFCHNAQPCRETIKHIKKKPESVSFLPFRGRAFPTQKNISVAS
ncbi:MAG: hypothetical protein IIW19_03575, partial [Clostridia bacterium]|nr:hypothetical protein [Clostridia bacterium]